MRGAKNGIIPPPWCAITLSFGYFSSTPPITSAVIATDVS